jgi:hypothetical protein
MIADIFNNCLTVAPMLDNLPTLSPSLVAVRFGSREIHKMPIARLLIDCVLQCKKSMVWRYLGGESLHGSCAVSTNLSNAHRPKFGSSSGVPSNSQGTHHVTK